MITGTGLRVVRFYSIYPSSIKCFSLSALKKNYNLSCTHSVECNNFEGLHCQTTPNKCNCPSTSFIGMCDCERDLLNEFFWNGTQCTGASSHGEPCLNVGMDYMCKTLTEGTVCATNSTSFTCQCISSQYFDGTKCIDKLSFNGTCSSNLMCLDLVGLSCSSLRCQYVRFKQYRHFL
jgi:hypothetical protein